METEEDIDFATMTAYQLIDMLDAAYPHVCIGPRQSEIEAHRYAGRRSLIDELVRSKSDEQNAKAEDWNGRE